MHISINAWPCLGQAYVVIRAVSGGTSGRMVEDTWSNPCAWEWQDEAEANLEACCEAVDRLLGLIRSGHLSPSEQDWCRQLP